MLFSPKVNNCNFSNLTRSNIVISDILFLAKYNPFNSLKFTFSNTSIFAILFSPKSNSSNFSNFTFSNTFISDILLICKYNSFNSLKFI